ncbi:hypothetical protein TNCV_1270591 [Trichonephila clavipes]|nr:hypothetical protein TNCV_1270591 [Trichonephila clavipes]
MSYPGFEPRPYGTAVSITNHYTGRATTHLVERRQSVSEIVSHAHLLITGYLLYEYLTTYAVYQGSATYSTWYNTQWHSTKLSHKIQSRRLLPAPPTFHFLSFSSQGRLKAWVNWAQGLVHNEGLVLFSSRP